MKAKSSYLPEYESGDSEDIIYKTKSLKNQRHIFYSLKKINYCFCIIYLFIIQLIVQQANQKINPHI